MDAEIDGGETFTCSAALAMEPASPTATKYSSCLRVKRSGMAGYVASFGALIKASAFLNI